MANILNIITNPNPILRKRSDEVSEEKLNSQEFKSLCDDMVLTMEKKDGVGLAAPQIGNNIRMVVVASKEGPMCMINPKLENNSWRREWGEEGCLSVPDTFGQVKRHKKTTCTYVDIDGNEKKIEAQGLLARIFQHEIDHLDGVLFIDKARNVKTLKEYKTGNKEKLR